MSDTDLWIIATGITASVSCAVLGCFLLLRRMSLLGDAITHSILPGLAGSFLITGTRSVGAMLAGALIVGVLTAVLSAKLTRWGRVPEDASLGVVFSTLFALGVVMISAAARDVDLDPGCVLYGLIEFVPFDTVPLLGIEIPRALLWLSVMFVLNITLVTLFYKELKLVSFDTNLAVAMGINASLIHYGFLTLVAATSVASFESVGSLLVVSMLIAPGATAHLFTDRLPLLLLLSAGIAALTAVVGYLLALNLNTSVAGMMSCVSGGLFLLAVVFAPRHGVLGKKIQHLLLSHRIRCEDILGVLYRSQEGGGAGKTTPGEWAEKIHTYSRFFTPFAVLHLQWRGFVERQEGGGVVLTSSGAEFAQRLVRSHRLWESFLAKHLALPIDHLHAPSERMEHFLTPEVLRELEAEVEGDNDPHGKPIPRDS